MNFILIKKYPLILTINCFLAACCASLTAYAQQTDFYGNSVEEVCLDDMSFNRDVKIEELVTSICEQAGFKNRYIVKSCSKIENCVATVHKGKPYILYNAQYLLPVRQLNFTYSNELPKVTDREKWKVLGVLAHEIGHHINLHLINAPENLSQITMELEADEFSGRSLYMMGATLEQALTAMEEVPEEGNGYTHPSKDQRIAAITKGYNNFKDKFPNQQIKDDDKTVLQQLQQAREYFHKEEYDKAFPIFYTYRMHHMISPYDMNCLGKMYSLGKGVTLNSQEGMKWYRKSAEMGDSEGQYWLGYYYGRGVEVEKNCKEFLYWTLKSAEQGDSWEAQQAQYVLASGYLNGYDCLSQDYKEAFKWYRKMAERGNPTGQAGLGYLYYYGKGGIELNYTEAANWYRKAADQGSPEAQIVMAQMYEKGRGVNKSIEEAVKWYRLAALQGYELAQQNLTRLGYGW